MKVCHQTNGRLRLRIAAMHQDPRIADRLASSLRDRDGILSVRANPACASLVIQFESHRLQAETVQVWVKTLSSGRSIAAATDRSLTRPIEQGPKLGWRQPLERLRDRTKALVRSPRRLAIAVPRKGAPTRESRPAKETPMLLCQLNLRLTRWMLRTSAQGWWHETRAERRRPSGHGRSATRGDTRRVSRESKRDRDSVWVPSLWRVALWAWVPTSLRS